MGRKKAKKAGAKGAGWLITFTDMMTLLLTFFVLLISMASMTDERKRLTALGSISGTFGVGDFGADVLSKTHSQNTPEPGPFENMKDFELLKPLLWEDQKKDLQLIENNFIQIFSINTALLFDSGSAILKPEGKDFLFTLLPTLKKVDFPFMLSGHTSILRDEYGKDYGELVKQSPIDPSWELSLNRTMAIYTFLLTNGLNPEYMRVEAYGSFKPRYSDDTPEGRKGNRRVDFILDRRNSSWAHRMVSQSRPDDPMDGNAFKYKDFLFNLQDNRQNN